MNFIEATYLITSIEKFDPKKEAKKLIDSTGLELSELSPEISEIEDFYDEDSKQYKALIKINFPVLLFRHDVASLISILYGEIVVPDNIKLIDINYPPAFLDHFNGPNAGIEGIRNELSIHHRPLITATIRPAIGLKTDKLLEIFKDLSKGGIDIIREDELFFNDSFAPYIDRIDAISDSKIKIEEERGRKVIYAPFISGSTVEMLEKIEYALERGINTFVVNLFPHGFETLQFLSDITDAIFFVNPGYPSFFYEKDSFGIEPSLLFGNLIRISGGDLILIPSPYRNKITPHYKSVEIAESLRENLENIKKSLPVIYGEIIPEDLYKIFKDFGNQIAIDIGNRYLYHKDGIFAGAKAYVDAVECAVTGTSYEECKTLNNELNRFEKS